MGWRQNVLILIGPKYPDDDEWHPIIIPKKFLSYLLLCAMVELHINTGLFSSFEAA
jgi:hypothetical protein